jgi:hypothetical protein
LEVLHDVSAKRFLVIAIDHPNTQTEIGVFLFQTIGVFEAGANQSSSGGSGKSKRKLKATSFDTSCLNRLQLTVFDHGNRPRNNLFFLGRKMPTTQVFLD